MATREERWAESGFLPKHMGDVLKCDDTRRRKFLLGRLAGKGFLEMELEEGFNRRGFVAHSVFRYYGLTEADVAEWSGQPPEAVEAFVDQLMADDELAKARGLQVALRRGSKAEKKKARAELAQRLETVSPEETEKVGTQKVRAYHEALRDLVMDVYGECCAFCETREPSQLTVSHLAPWAKKPEWRLNPRNSVLACKAHDSLIDKGLITLDEQFGIVVSPLLDLSKNKALEQIIKMASFRAPEEYGPAPECLAFHREKVFKKAKETKTE
jgi:hypothetical protein